MISAADFKQAIEHFDTQRADELMKRGYIWLVREYSPVFREWLQILVDSHDGSQVFH